MKQSGEDVWHFVLLHVERINMFAGLQNLPDPWLQ